MRHQRDETYFSWRFNNPRTQYTFFFHRDTDLNGYLVLRLVRRNSGTTGYLVDWEALSPEVLERLLDTALCSDLADVFQTWTATLDEQRLAMLRAAGFQEHRRQGSVKPSVLVHPLPGSPSGAGPTSIEWLANLAHWDLRMIYADNH